MPPYFNLASAVATLLMVESSFSAVSTSRRAFPGCLSSSWNIADALPRVAVAASPRGRLERTRTRQAFETVLQISVHSRTRFGHKNKGGIIIGDFWPALLAEGEGSRIFFSLASSSPLSTVARSDRDCAVPRGGRRLGVAAIGRERVDWIKLDQPFAGIEIAGESILSAFPPPMASRPLWPQAEKRIRATGQLQRGAAEIPEINRIVGLELHRLARH